MNDQEKLDAICREAFQRLDALDLEMYQRGFVTRKGRWSKPSLPAFGASKAEPKGPSPLGVEPYRGPLTLGPNNGAKVLLG